MPSSVLSRAVLASPTFPAAPIWTDWRMLCETIGERRAGTTAERLAADYIADRFRAAEADEVAIEPFPCLSLRRAKVAVHVRRGSRWESVDATTLVGAPGTPD